MNEENPKYTSETELFLQQFRDQVIGITEPKGKVRRLQCSILF